MFDHEPSCRFLQKVGSNCETVAQELIFLAQSCGFPTPSPHVKPGLGCLTLLVITCLTNSQTLEKVAVHMGCLLFL